ncbi:MAG: response regulator [Candidatus Moranbacteria bacterium]|nr:response regulator [Candidatus Moranbacteria bacterium]
MEKNPWGKTKVCIIDDADDIREIYSVKFLTEDYDVVSAKDGEEGLRLIREEKPDVILLDLQMPVKDGFAVLKELRDDAELKHIPVLILSNVDDEQTFKKVGSFETRFYLIKSLVTPQKVVDTVREALRFSL